MYKNIVLFITALVLVGCGADSDLLKDENINKKPSGKAYDILKEDIYDFREVNSSKLGFDYLTLDDECNTKECSLLEATYFFENKESTNVPLDKKIVLTPNGWYEKSKHRECKIKFSGNSFIESCPDGTKFDIKITEIELEGQALNQVHNAELFYSKLKDQQATFTYDSKKYDFSRTSPFDIYEVVDTESTKCTANHAIARNDSALFQHTVLSCKIDGMSITIGDVPASSGIAVINGSSQQAWTKETVNERYTIIDLGIINGKSYFIAGYNSYVRIGTIIPQSSIKSYINTEAFNVIYTQLKDEYK